jgi:hypothetical protein
MKKLILFLMVMIGAAQAQYMTVTASGCLVDGSGTAIVTGTLTVLGTDQNNNPIPYRAGSAFQATTVPIVRTITAGSLASSLQLADPLTTSPTNILYWFRLQDNTSKKITDYKGIILQANDVFTGGHFTQFNICKMNPLPLTPQISYETVSIINNATETITGDLSVQGNRSVLGNDTVGGTLGVTGNTTVGGTLGVTGNTTVGGTLGVTGLTSTKNIAAIQNANGDNAIKIKRFTDSSPTGNYIQFRNAADSLDVASISTTGQGNFVGITGTSLTLGSDSSFSSSPRSVWNAFIPVTTSTLNNISFWTVDKAITITRMELGEGLSASGCSTTGVVSVYNGTTNIASVALSGGHDDSGALGLSVSAGTVLNIRVTTAANCSGNPANVTVSVQYKMQ